jgi:hypothetical protein
MFPEILNNNKKKEAEAEAEAEEKNLEWFNQEREKMNPSLEY